MSDVGARHHHPWAITSLDGTGVPIALASSRLALGSSLLEELAELTQHLPSLVGGVMLAQLGAHLFSTKLREQISQ